MIDLLPIIGVAFAWTFIVGTICYLWGRHDGFMEGRK